MALTKTDLNGQPNSLNPKPEFNQSEDPTIERKRQKILKDKQRINDNFNRKLDQLKKSYADTLREVACALQSKLAQEDPYEIQYLYDQILPVLKKLGINNIIEKKDIQVFEEEQNNNDEFLYRVLLRRKSELKPDIIDRIDRTNKSFKKMNWTSDGIEVFVWGPNILLSEEKKREEEKRKKLPEEIPNTGM